MKKVPFYRRVGRGGDLKERMVWQLSKGPMSETELAELFGMELMLFRNRAQVTFRVGSPSLVIEQADNGPVYSLHGKARRTTSHNKTIIVSFQSLEHRGAEQRQKNIEAAARRRRLMAADLYLPALD